LQRNPSYKINWKKFKLECISLSHLLFRLDHKFAGTQQSHYFLLPFKILHLDRSGAVLYLIKEKSTRVNFIETTSLGLPLQGSFKNERTQVLANHGNVWFFHATDHPVFALGKFFSTFRMKLLINDSVLRYSEMLIGFLQIGIFLFVRPFGWLGLKVPVFNFNDIFLILVNHSEQFPFELDKMFSNSVLLEIRHFLLEDEV